MKIGKKYVNSLICTAVPVYFYRRDTFIKEMEKFSRADFTLQNTEKYWNNYKHGNEKGYFTEFNQIPDNQILNLTIQSTNFVPMLLCTSMLFSIVLILESYEEVNRKLGRMC